MLESLAILNLADDVTFYVHGKTKDIVESRLNEDLKDMSYFKTNQLIINLSKGKSKTMVYGMSSRLSKCDKKLTLYYYDRVIRTTETYKYLGTILDSTLSLSTNFKKMYRKTTSKLRRLYSLRMYFDSSPKAKIFKAMIFPCITYNCTIDFLAEDFLFSLLNSKSAHFILVQCHISLTFSGGIEM